MLDSEELFINLVLWYQVCHNPDQGPRCDTAKEEPEGPQSSLLAILHFIGLIKAETKEIK